LRNQRVVKPKIINLFVGFVGLIWLFVKFKSLKFSPLKIHFMDVILTPTFFDALQALYIKARRGENFSRAEND